MSFYKRGDIVKKWCAIIFLMILSLLLWYKGEKLEPTFIENYLNYDSENNFVVRKIDVSKRAITTKNITSLLNGVSLRRIEYEIPELYLAKFSDDNFEYSLLDGNLLEIENKISNKFKSLGYQREVERIYFYGLKLVSIEVYGRESEIEAFESKIKVQS